MAEAAGIEPEAGQLPRVLMAVFFTSATEAEDRVLSVERIFDQLNVTFETPEVPDELPPVEIEVQCFIILYADGMIGDFTMDTLLIGPSGRRGEPTPVPVQFDRPDRVLRLKIVGQFRLIGPGKYHFELSMREQILTRVPLNVDYQTIVVPTDPENPEPIAD